MSIGLELFYADYLVGNMCHLEGKVRDWQSSSRPSMPASPSTFPVTALPIAHIDRWLPRRPISLRIAIAPQPDGVRNGRFPPLVQSSASIPDLADSLRAPLWSSLARGRSCEPSRVYSEFEAVLTALDAVVDLLISLCQAWGNDAPG